MSVCSNCGSPISNRRCLGCGGKIMGAYGPGWIVQECPSESEIYGPGGLAQQEREATARKSQTKVRRPIVQYGERH